MTCAGHCLLGKNIWASWPSSVSHIWPIGSHDETGRNSTLLDSCAWSRPKPNQIPILQKFLPLSFYQGLFCKICYHQFVGPGATSTIGCSINGGREPAPLAGGLLAAPPPSPACAPPPLLVPKANAASISSPTSSTVQLGRRRRRLLPALPPSRGLVPILASLSGHT